jgi:hypothetical protein
MTIALNKLIKISSFHVFIPSYKTLREERTLRVLEDRVLRRIFGPKRAR